MIESTMQTSKQRTRLVLSCGMVIALASHARAGLRLVETIPGIDFNVGQNTIEQSVFGTTTEPIYGVGITARWTAVIADDVGGTAPWPLDMSVDVVAPDGTSTLSWPVIGGDRTIADFPFQDAAPGFNGVEGTGEFLWLFDTISPAPYTSGLRDVEYHLLTDAPDVEMIQTGTTEGGPLWNRPYAIVGTSGLGPVSYHAMQFSVNTPGRYTFLSEVVGEHNFNFIYQDHFDPKDQLTNLLDYGLGNGNAPNGTPSGTSFIDVLLRSERTYTYITSQWSATSDPVPFTTTIIGPDSLVAVCTTCTPGDFDGNDAVDAADYLYFSDCLSGPDATPNPTVTGATANQCLIAFDSDDDLDIDLTDFGAFQAAFESD